MNIRHLLLAGVCAIALPAAASAQSQSGISEGFYAGAQTGASWLNTVTIDGPVDNDLDFEEDWTGLLEAGYRLGNGLRLGGEFSYTDHTVDGIAGGNATRVGGRGDFNVYTYMAVAAYEFDTGAAIRPYLSIGAGLASVEYDNVGPLFTAGQFADDDDSGFAYQAGAGLIWGISQNLEASLNYRYLDTEALNYTTSAGTSFDEDYQNHSVLVGVRWVFGAAPPPPPPAPTPAPAPVSQPAPPPAPAAVAPPPAISRNFTVFFDWDSAELTADARQVLNNVVDNARQGNIMTIEVIGHADTSGPADYNQRLSVRRANAVREYLLSAGMSAADIDVAGRGENELLVPTPDGVREPSNRRAVILFP